MRPRSLPGWILAESRLGTGGSVANVLHLDLMETIPQRELRNRISAILRRVESGESVRITVNGRPVADLVPIAGVRRTFVPREEISRLLRRAPLDQAFRRDIDSAVDTTIDDL